MYLKYCVLVLCRLLDKIDPGHCEKNIEHDEGERTLE